VSANAALNDLGHEEGCRCPSCLPEAHLVPETSTALAPRADTYEWNGVRFYVFRARACVIAADVGRYLGYADEGRSLTERVRGEWREEFACGADFDVLEQDDLREFKATLARTTPGVVRRNVNHITILYERGVDKVILKTEKPQGVALREALAREILPRLRRGEKSGAGFTLEFPVRVGPTMRPSPCG